MNKVLLKNFILLLLVFIALPAMAQETASEAESAPRAVAEPAPAPVVTPPVVSMPSAPRELGIVGQLRNGMPIHVKQEEEFDTNGNRRLEPGEIRAFLKKVHADSAGGPVKNTSDILYDFDKNQDGFIDRSEASALLSYSN